MAVARGGGGRGASCPTSPVAGRRGRSRSPRPAGYDNQGGVAILPPEAGVGRPNSRGPGKGAVQRQPSRARSFASALGAEKGGATPGGGGGAALESPTGERVIVGVRLRPLLPREQVKVQGGGGAVSAWIEPPNRVILQDPQTKQGRSFDCDFAFDSTDPKSENFADQKLVYDGIGAKIVGHTLDGYNSCLLAYGQTGTGKTYTIVGDYAGIVEEYGLLPRMADRLFAELGRLRQEGSTVHVQASYVEIYNNQLVDLLAVSDIGTSSATSGAGGPPPQPQRPPRSGQQAAQRKSNRLVIHTHPDIGVYVENLSELAVHNASEVHKVLVAGARSRHTAKTSMNDRSSRSHTVFSLKVELRNVGDAGRNRMATAQVVDLAGRENEQSTEVTGERLKELSFINQSLFQLANCISALTKSSRDHIPFRDSKLTMLVSESFQRNSRTCLLAALTPAPSGYDENLLTCRFLESARRIVTKPYVNEFSSEDLRGKLQEEVQRIQKQLGSFDLNDAELLSRQAMLQHVSKSWAEYEDAMSRFLADQPDQSTAEAMREAMLNDVCAAVGRSLDGATTAVKSLETRQSAIGASLGKAESQLSAVEARVQKLRQKRGFSVPAKDRVKLPPVPPSDAAHVAARTAGSAPSVTVSVSLPPIVMLH